MGKVKFKFDFFAILAFIVLLISKNEYTVLTVIAVIIHEIGHIFAALVFKIKISEFSIGILGARIKTSTILTSYFQEIMISLFGPLFNLFSAVFVFFLFNSQHDDRIAYFAVASVLLGVLNLLPIKSFDGGRIVECVFSVLFPDKIAFYIVNCISFFFIVSLWMISVYFLLIYTSSLGLFVFSALLFCNIFIENKF